MFDKTRLAMLKLSLASRRKVAGQVLELLRQREARQALQASRNQGYRNQSPHLIQEWERSGSSNS